MPPSTVSTRPRVINIALAYGIGINTLKDFLKSLGYNLNNTNLLPKELLPIIEKQFQGDKNSNERVKGKKTVIDPKESLLPITPISQNSAAEEEFKHKVLHLESNLFSKQKQLIQYKSFPIINSFFHDTEAVNLCSKMSSSYTRNLCTQLSNPKNNKQLLLYQIHAIANKSLKLFGGKMLSFIFHLRNLNFKNKTALEIKTYQQVIPDFPVISFISKNSSFKIAFFLKRDKINNELKADVRLFSPKNYEQVGYIDEQGYVLTKLEKYKPQLDLFYEASLDNKLDIRSGVETGKCELCPHTLTHPTSLRIGIGPICARNHNIDTSLYRYN